MHRFILVAVFALLLAACGESEPPAGQLSPQDEALYQQAAATLIDNLAGELGGKLKEAIEEGGPSNAIYVCRSEAPRAAAAHSQGGWTIRRVSDRVRNPHNRADATELALMQQFADSAAPAFSERWDKGDSSAVYYYYQPIRTKLLCLKCHGTESNMDPVVAAAVAEYYPDDQARNYDIGELRGLFVVTGEWPTGGERAQELTASGQ
jgi:hypothetical protein